VLTKGEEGDRHDGSFRGQEIGAPREQECLVQRDRGTQPPARPIALHRVAEAPTDGVGHPRRVVGSVGEEAQRDRAGSLPAGPREGLERRTVANAPDQAERRLRPRARRARSTARPPLVRIRRRKPWVLARLRLLGWYVRFKEEPPRGGRARSGVGDRAGGGNVPVYGSDPALRNAGRPGSALAAASGENPHSPLSHKDTGATLRASLGRRRAVRLVPMCPSTTPAEPVQHIWVISTPVDLPVDNIGGGRQDHPQWS